MRAWRRWIIRSLLLGLLVCVSGFWWDSHSYQLDLAYTKSRTVLVISYEGQVRAYWFEKPFASSGYTDGFEVRHFYSTAGFSDKTYLGFAVGHQGVMTPYFGFAPAMANQYWYAGAPFWFLAIMAASTTVYGWKRTREGKVSRAFPIDASKNYATDEE